MSVTGPAGNEPPQATRRRLLYAGGAALSGALLASGCSKPGPHDRVRRAGPVPRADVGVLNGLLDLEHETIAAYEAGIPLLDPVHASVAEQFLRQEFSHAGELNGLVKDAHGQPATPRLYRFGHPRTSEQVLALLYRLERAQLAAYVVAIPQVTDGDARGALAAMFANDAQHVAVLRATAHRPPAPEAFVSGRE